MQDMQVQFLGQEDPLEKGTATHSSILDLDRISHLSKKHFSPLLEYDLSARYIYYYWAHCL